MNLIVAHKNGCLGSKGKLLWHLPEELKLFKSLTLNNVCVFGKTTFLGLPYLKDRTTVVLSNQHLEVADFCVPNITECLELLKQLDKPVFISGGANVYSQFLNLGLIKKLYVSEITADIDVSECDTFLPEFTGFTQTEIKNYEGFTHSVWISGKKK